LPGRPSNTDFWGPEGALSAGERGKELLLDIVVTPAVFLKLSRAPRSCTPTQINWRVAFKV
jgi:hypothetical protein